MEFQCLLLAFVCEVSTSMQLDEQHRQFLQQSSLQRESSFDQNLAKRPRLEISLEDECLQKRSDEHVQMHDILNCDDQDKMMQNNLLYNEIEEMMDNFMDRTEGGNSQNEYENIVCQLLNESSLDFLSLNDTHNITGDSFSTQTFEACCPYKQTNFSTQCNPEVSIDHCLAGLDNIETSTGNEKCQNNTDMTDRNTLCCVNTDIEDTMVDQMLNSIAEIPYKELLNIIEDIIIAAPPTNNDTDGTGKEICTTNKSLYTEISRIVDAAKSGVSFISFEKFNEKTNSFYITTQKRSSIAESASTISRNLKKLFFRRLDILKHDRTDIVHKCKIDINPKMRDELADLIQRLSQKSENSPDEISNSQCSTETIKNVFDLCINIEKYNLESFSTKTIRLLYLALTAHLCFDYNPSIACYVLKDGLWGIHVHMSEFYFYLIWKLQRLNNEYVDYYKNEISYKEHLIKEISLIAKILMRYKILDDEGIEMNGQRTNLINLITEIEDFRHHIMDFLQKFHANENSAALYYLALNMRNAVYDSFDTSPIFALVKKDLSKESCTTERQQLNEQNTRMPDYAKQTVQFSITRDHHKVVKNSIYITAFISDCLQKPMIACNAQIHASLSEGHTMKFHPSHFFFERIYKVKNYQDAFDNAFLNIMIMSYFFKTTGSTDTPDNYANLYLNKFDIDCFSKSFILRSKFPRRKRMMLLRELVLYSMGQEIE